MEKARATAMIETMAEMQISHNEHVHPDWLTQGYEYYRAVWVECAELLDHFGWKWWKKQQPDLDQVKLEIVDIWHFGLSDLIRANELEKAVPHLLAAATRSEPDVDAFRLGGIPGRDHSGPACVYDRTVCRGSRSPTPVVDGVV